MAWIISHRLSNIFEESWVCPAELGAFLIVEFTEFGRKKENKVLWQFAVFTVLWSLGLKMNARVFKQQFLPPDLIWDRITSLSSLCVHAMIF